MPLTTDQGIEFRNIKKSAARLHSSHFLCDTRQMSDSNQHETPLLPSWQILTFVGMITIIRLVTAAYAPLTGDEAYYRLWSLYPDWGYYDHAPMVAWWTALGRSLFGDTNFAVRFMAPVSAGVGSLFLWRTAALLLERPSADRTVIWFNAMLIVGFGSIVMTPDIPSVFFWGMTLWALAEANKSRKDVWWLLVGASAGLGIQSKYSVLFLGPGILLWLALIPANRFWFRRWGLWIGGAIAAFVASPLVYWNATHEWVSFLKQFGRTVPKSWSLQYLPEFIGAMLLLITPFIFGFALIGFVRAVRLSLSGNSKLSLPVLTSIPFLVYLVSHSLHDRVQGNWPVPMMPAFAILAAFAASLIVNSTTSARWKKQCVTVAAPLGFILSTIIVVEVLRPFLPITASVSPLAEMRGWTEFSREVDQRRKASGAAWVATLSYNETGQLAFQLDHEVPVIQIDQRIRYIFAPEPDSALIKSAGLLVAPASKVEAYRLRTIKCNVQIEPLGTLDRTDNGITLETYSLFRITGAMLETDVPIRGKSISACP